jgi:four helix bundle protein
MKIESYKDLLIWQKGIELTGLIYDITDKFPGKENYGLVSQMQRAAVSIPSNIAEGFNRQHLKEYRQFCFIALSSCAELETQLIIAHNRQYITESIFNSISEVINHESRMIRKLLKNLK